MVEERGTYVSKFDRAAMTTFFAEFETPEAKSDALEVVRKAEKITATATEIFNESMVRFQDGTAPAPGTPTNWSNIARLDQATEKYRSRVQAISRAKGNQLGQLLEEQKLQKQLTPTFNRHR